MLTTWIMVFMTFNPSMGTIDATKTVFETEIKCVEALEKKLGNQPEHMIGWCEMNMETLEMKKDNTKPEFAD